MSRQARDNSYESHRFIAEGDDGVYHRITLPSGYLTTEAVVPDLPNLRIVGKANNRNSVMKYYDRHYSPNGSFYATIVRGKHNRDYVRLYTDDHIFLTESNYTPTKLQFSKGWGFGGWAADSSGVFLFYESEDFDPQSPVYKLNVPDSSINQPVPTPEPQLPDTKIVIPPEQSSFSLTLSPDRNTLILGPRTVQDFNWHLINLQTGTEKNIEFPCIPRPLVWVNDSLLYGRSVDSIQGLPGATYPTFCHYLVDIKTGDSYRVVVLSSDTSGSFAMLIAISG